MLVILSTLFALSFVTPSVAAAYYSVTPGIHMYIVNEPFNIVLRNAVQAAAHEIIDRPLPGGFLTPNSTHISFVNVTDVRISSQDFACDECQYTAPVETNTLQVDMNASKTTIRANVTVGVKDANKVAKGSIEIYVDEFWVYFNTHWVEKYGHAQFYFDWLQGSTFGTKAKFTISSTASFDKKWITYAWDNLQDQIIAAAKHELSKFITEKVAEYNHSLMNLSKTFNLPGNVTLDTSLINAPSFDEKYMLGEFATVPMNGTIMTGIPQVSETVPNAGVGYNHNVSQSLSFAFEDYVPNTYLATLAGYRETIRSLNTTSLIKVLPQLESQYGPDRPVRIHYRIKDEPRPTLQSLDYFANISAAFDVAVSVENQTTHKFDFALEGQLNAFVNLTAWIELVQHEDPHAILHGNVFVIYPTYVNIDRSVLDAPVDATKVFEGLAWYLFPSLTWNLNALARSGYDITHYMPDLFKRYGHILSNI